LEGIKGEGGGGGGREKV
jgi:hypothetical protein